MILNRVEKSLLFLFFLSIWAYLFVRGYTVHMVHDEIVTKWSYMIDWNFLPYSGYIDANNHFLISFLGGFLIRIFNSDSIIIGRLASLFAFPILFFSLYQLRFIFKSKDAFIFTIASICFTQFLLDFFSLARGYALSWAFMVTAISTSITYLRNSKVLYLILSYCFWVIALIANISFLPTVICGTILLSFLSLRKKQLVYSFLPFLINVAIIIYFTLYAFDLKALNKLYLGSSENFLKTVLHPLTEYLFGISNIILDVFVICISAIIVSFSTYKLIKRKSITPENIIPILFILGVISILLQNILLGVNYPENRSVGYLLILFLISLGIVIDQLKIRYISFILLLLFLGSFIVKANLNKTLVYEYEHFDEEFLRRIPNETNGIPSSTGGRFWTIENEIGRKKEFPTRAFQNSKFIEDTLIDYLITFPELRPDIDELYTPIYRDTISEIVLFKRNEFLKRDKINEISIEFNNNNEFTDVIQIPGNQLPCFLRLKGKFEDLSIYEEASIIFSIEDSVTHDKFFYEGFGNASNIYINKEKEATFDLTYALNEYSKPAYAKCYIYNPQKHLVQGKIKAEVWKINKE